jgi:hypothetical protein
VARGGAPLRSDAAVTIFAAGALRVLRRPGQQKSVGFLRRAFEMMPAPAAGRVSV